MNESSDKELRHEKSELLFRQSTILFVYAITSLNDLNLQINSDNQ